jgi:uncharacterized membrane protein
MAEREYPSGFSGALPDESARWVSGGLISEEQRSAILGLYPASEASGRDRTVLIFSILGAVLVGAGVLLFFAANWQAIPALVKVGMILAAVVGAYGSGYYLQYVRGDFPRLGHGLIFLGTLFYGAGIFLVAQIFHLDSHWPNGFLLWAIGVLPIAAAAESRPALYLATVLLGIWTASEQAAFQSYNYLFPVLLLGVALPLARRLRADLAEAGVLAELFLWFGVNAMNGLTRGMSVDEAHGGMILFGSMILYSVALLVLGLARAGDEPAYMGVGSLGVLVGSYALTFEWYFPWQTFQQTLVQALARSPFAIAGIGVMLAGVLAGAWLYWRRGEPERVWLLPAALVPVAAAFSLFWLEAVPRMITFNLLLFAATVGLVVYGVQRRSSLLVNLGLTAFLIHVLTRYFDLFFSAMNKSLFFIVGGVLLLGGGWLLERNRRRWMREIGGGGGHAA